MCVQCVCSQRTGAWSSDLEQFRKFSVLLIVQLTGQAEQCWKVPEEAVWKPGCGKYVEKFATSRSLSNVPSHPIASGTGLACMA